MLPNLVLLFQTSVFCLFFSGCNVFYLSGFVCVYVSPSLPVSNSCLSLAWLQNVNSNEQENNLAVSLFTGDGFLLSKRMNLFQFIAVVVKVDLKSFNKKMLSLQFIMFEVTNI